MAIATRDYAAEYKRYGGTEKQKKRRAMRNKARRKMIKAGKVRKGGPDVDHRNHNPMDSSMDNLRVRSVRANRADNLGRGGRPKGSKTKKRKR